MEKAFGIFSGWQTHLFGCRSLINALSSSNLMIMNEACHAGCFRQCIPGCNCLAMHILIFYILPWDQRITQNEARRTKLLWVVNILVCTPVNLLLPDYSAKSQIMCFTINCNCVTWKKKAVFAISILVIVQSTVSFSFPFSPRLSPWPGFQSVYVRCWRPAALSISFVSLRLAWGLLLFSALLVFRPSDIMQEPVI